MKHFTSVIFHDQEMYLMISDQVHWWKDTSPLSGVYKPFYIFVEMAFPKRLKTFLVRVAIWQGCDGLSRLWPIVCLFTNYPMRCSVDNLHTMAMGFDMLTCVALNMGSLKWWKTWEKRCIGYDWWLMRNERNMILPPSDMTFLFSESN